MPTPQHHLHPVPNDQSLLFRITCLCHQITPSTTLVPLLQSLSGGLCPSTQQWFLHTCLADPLASKFPRGLNYEYKLLRAVVVAAEADGHALHEDLMEAFASMLLQSNSKPSSPVEEEFTLKIFAYGPPLLFPSHSGSNTSSIPRADSLFNATGTVTATQIQTKSTATQGILALHISRDVLSGGTGHWAWEAGFFLSEFILNHPHLFTNAFCLELGSGVGMAGVCLERVGATRVVLTDANTEALANCQRNIDINNDICHSSCCGGSRGVEKGVIDVVRLQWEDGADEIIDKYGSVPSIIVAADVLYDPNNVAPFVAIVKEFLKRGTTAVYVATIQRNETTMQVFIDYVRAEVELHMEEVVVSCQECYNDGGGSDGDAADDALRTREKGGIRFYHMDALEAARPRLLLHKMSLAIHPLQRQQQHHERCIT